jgi:dihydrolipoamide dehydrogenase
MTRTLEVDVAIVGAGSAGLTAYRAARAHTDRVLLIEGERHGTTCARVGCMPSKLLIAAADAAHAVAEAPVFGVHASVARIDGRAVMERVRSERDRFTGFVIESVEAFPPETRVDGHARFVSPHRLEVGGHAIVEAGRIVLATGSRPVVPPELAGLESLVIDNEDVFNWTDLPESIAVLGTGPIGLELGQALHRLGVRVRVFGRNGALASLTDPDVRARAERVLAGELDLDLHARIERVVERDGGVEITFRDPDGLPRAERFAFVLAATGRRPNLDGLALEHSGLVLDARGAPGVDRFTRQCGTSHIFLAGDASAERTVLHEAVDDGRIAGDNAGRFPDVRCQSRRAPLAIVFTDPQIATVGRGYRDLADGGADFAIGEASFDDQGRSRIMHRNQGLLRLYGLRGSGELVGGEMIAPRAEHLAHLLAWSVQQRRSVAELLAMPFYHPVVEEGVRAALRELNRQLRMGPEPVPRCLDCGPGA